MVFILFQQLTADMHVLAIEYYNILLHYLTLLASYTNMDNLFLTGSITFP